MHPTEAAGPTPDLISVFTAPDATVLPVVEALLENAGIAFWARREGLQDLFAWGRLGAGHNLIVGPVELFVHPDEASRARELLAEFARSDDAAELPDELK